MPDGITIQHPDHGDITIDAGALTEAGYVPRSSLDDDYVPRADFEVRLREAKREARRGLTKPDELLDDEDFRRKLADKHGDWFRETLAIKPEEGTVEQIRASLMESEVKPLRQQLETRDTTIQTLRRKQRDGDIERAMGIVGVKPQFRPLALAWARERLALHPEHAEWFVTDGQDDGEPQFAFSKKPKDGRPPYQTAEEMFALLAQSGEYPDWFEKTTKPGSGYEGGGTGGGDISLDQFQKMTSTERTALFRKDPDQWRRLMEEMKRSSAAAYDKVAQA